MNTVLCFMFYEIYITGEVSSDAGKTLNDDRQHEADEHETHRDNEGQENNRSEDTISLLHTLIVKLVC